MMKWTSIPGGCLSSLFAINHLVFGVFSSVAVQSKYVQFLCLVETTLSEAADVPGEFLP